MKKQYLTVLLALICLFGLGAGAQAQEEGRVVSKIPYEFVAGGKTLPAGTYIITRISSDRDRPWEIRNTVTPKESALLQPLFLDGAIDHAGLSLERVGDTYYLYRVTTSAGAFTLSVPRAANTVARGKQYDAISAAGAN
jgi:hypothetical protein